MRRLTTSVPICNSQFAIRNLQSHVACCVLFLALSTTQETIAQKTIAQKTIAQKTSAQKTSAPEPKRYPTHECRWATGPITIDGQADEPAWQQAELLDNFGQPWLPEKPKAKTATNARLLWDRDNLYFFADLEDHDLFANLTQHDDRTWLNDVFELFFRPDENKPPYYEFQVNAAGTMLDIYFRQKGVPFDEAKRDGEFHWQAAVVRRGTLDNRDDRDEIWSVEGRIPWDDFARTGGRPAAGDTWRFALCRYDYTASEKPETSTMAPLSQPSFHLLEDYARLKFVGIKTSAVERGSPDRARAGIPTQAFVTTSKVLGSPDPPLPYRPVRAFPNLKLTFPIALDHIPGSDQLLIIAQDKPYGPATILRIADDPAVEKAEQVLEIPAGGTAYGICFHPRFAENGYLYVGWNGALADSNKPEASARDNKSKRTIVTRYTMDRATFALDKDSALDIISWESNGHNGGDLEFGLDRMLYVTSGDGTSDSDTNLRGQDLTHLTAKVLRIDVDQSQVEGTLRVPSAALGAGLPTPPKNYSVPPDNPFVGQDGVVPETWAYGLRNPWRIAVDPKTGHVWVGNNGQDLWEQVYFVRKGDNFGWSVYEGSHIFYANRKLGPQPLTPPAADHHHSEARSLTGGVVYYGTKLPELYGAYIYGDHSTGRIWGIRHDGAKVTWHKLLADTTFNISGFGLDSHGELLVADHHGDGAGGYYYLEESGHLAPRDAKAGNEPRSPDTTAKSRAFPRKLSDSGLFANVKEHVMQPGVIPYSVNAPLWSDGAYKERYFAIPQQASANFKIDLAKKNGWDFPDETVLIKSFALETTAGDPSSRRWIETRFLTKQAGEWAGYSYIWNDEQTDAELVSAAGLDREYTVGDRKQSWHFPSRVECMVCHSRAANFVLGLQTAQMNKQHDYGGTTAQQLDVLRQLELVKEPKNRKPEEPKLPQLVDPYDDSEPLEARARAYLHANCSICHMQAGGGNAQIDLEYQASLKKMNVVDVPPLHHKFGLGDARLVAPGHPERSVLLYRIAHRGQASGQMPQLATNVVDQQAVKLIEDWIRSLQPPEQ
jgi:uncharacterized repeat protein (TIGR03806 family)